MLPEVSSCQSLFKNHYDGIPYKFGSYNEYNTIMYKRAFKIGTKIRVKCKNI